MPKIFGNLNFVEWDFRKLCRLKMGKNKRKRKRKAEETEVEGDACGSSSKSLKRDVDDIRLKITDIMRCQRDSIYR